MVRSVMSSAVILSVVLIVEIYMVRSVISSAVIWCVVLSVLLLFGAYCYQ